MTKSDVTYAVIRVGGQQFKVSAGDTIVVDRVDAEEGKSVTYDTLAVRTDSGAFDGDAAKHAKVKAKVSEHLLGENAGIGVDHTIFAKVSGRLVFTEKGAGRFISVVPEA